MLWGRLRSALLRLPRYEDPQFRAYLRRYQWLALLHGKRRAAELMASGGHS
jgi:hypothetical protein